MKTHKAWLLDVDGREAEKGTKPIERNSSEALLAECRQRWGPGTLSRRMTVKDVVA